MNNKRCVLAYSGGLDTSAILVWLVEAGYEVHCLLVDVGQDEDLEALTEKAMRYKATTAIIRDVKPDMLAAVAPYAIGLGATYEGNYRLGTALARPFIAAAQVERARELGGATLVHGATGKGNDQVRFEFAYRSLAPEYPVLAPWKCWPFQGRQDLVDYLQGHGINDNFEVTKEFSLDENLWHLSIEGGPLEQPEAIVDVDAILANFADRFHAGQDKFLGAPFDVEAGSVSVLFKHGVPVAVNGVSKSLGEILVDLNTAFRHAVWGWDLIIENRFTGIKSRGVYINPAVKLLHVAVDALARSSFNKPTFDEYVFLGKRYADVLYRGEYFADQRLALEACAKSLLSRLNGEVVVSTAGVPYAASIKKDAGIFTQDLATFEESSFDHRDAQGFIALSWLSSIGRPFEESQHANIVEANECAASDICGPESMPAGGLVSTRS
ncbi:MAG: argininosuccinate synthase [Planctomycetota bacterium]|jgi:argininosuccinate synthase